MKPTASAITKMTVANVSGRYRKLDNLSELLGTLFKIAGKKKNHVSLAHSFDHSVRIGLLAGAVKHGSLGKFH